MYKPEKITKFFYIKAAFIFWMTPKWIELINRKIYFFAQVLKTTSYQIDLKVRVTNIGLIHI